MVVELLLTFTAGLFAGGGLSKLLRKTATKPIIHIRGKIPWKYKHACEESGTWVFSHNAEYLDQDTRAWCGEHLPKTTRYAERAAMDDNGGSYCHAHGMDCPKPWSIV